MTPNVFCGGGVTSLSNFLKLNCAGVSDSLFSHFSQPVPTFFCSWENVLICFCHLVSSQSPDRIVSTLAECTGCHILGFLHICHYPNLACVVLFNSWTLSLFNEIWKGLQRWRCLWEWGQHMTKVALSDRGTAITSMAQITLWHRQEILHLKWKCWSLPPQVAVNLTCSWD